MAQTSGPQDRARMRPCVGEGLTHKPPFPGNETPKGAEGLFSCPEKSIHSKALLSCAIVTAFRVGKPHFFPFPHGLKVCYSPLQPWSRDAGSQSLGISLYGLVTNGHSIAGQGKRGYTWQAIPGFSGGDSAAFLSGKLVGYSFHRLCAHPFFSSCRRQILLCFLRGTVPQISDMG